jgi:hypothetical protein
MIVLYIMGFIIGLGLILSFFAMFTTNSDPMTDYELYGMDADEYEEKIIKEYEKSKNT